MENGEDVRVNSSHLWWLGNKFGFPLLFGPITHANNQTKRIKLVKGIKKKQNGLRFLKIPFTSMPFPPATSAHFRFFVESAHGILA